MPYLIFRVSESTRWGPVDKCRLLEVSPKDMEMGNDLLDVQPVVVHRGKSLLESMQFSNVRYLGAVETFAVLHREWHEQFMQHLNSLEPRKKSKPKKRKRGKK